VAFVAAAEIGGDILGPLVGLGDENAIGIVGLDLARILRMTSWVSDRFSQFVPCRSTR
jgi:hypothetical protein